MPDKLIFTRTDAGFDTQINEVVPYLVTNSVRLVISAGNVTILNGILPGWSPIYLAEKNPATSNHTLVLNKDAMMRLIKGQLLSIYDDIPNSVLTNEDKTTLHL